MTTPSPVFGGWAVNPLGLEPAGVVAATFSRDRAAVTLPAAVSGTPIVRAVILPAGLQVNNISLGVIGAAATSTHAWAALLTAGGQVVAVSADNVTANGGLPAGTYVTIPMAAPGVPYVTPYNGVYYIVQCSVAGTMPTFAGDSPLAAAGLNVLAPVLAATGPAGQTTPPALGAILALASAAGNNLYANIS